MGNVRSILDACRDNTEGWKINVYRSDDRWYGARWNDCEWDGVYPIEVASGATSKAAIAAVRAEFPGAKIQMVKNLYSRRVLTGGYTPEEIDAATGFAQGEKFETDDQVEKYFTVSNMRDMFSGDEKELPSQEELDDMAQAVIANRWHMVDEK